MKSSPFELGRKKMSSFSSAVFFFLFFFSFLFSFLSSYVMLLCCVVLCCVVSCRVMSCYVMSCHVMLLFHVISCFHVCYVMSCCYFMSFHVVMYVMYVMSCHVMSCHVILSYVSVVVVVVVGVGEGFVTQKCFFSPFIGLWSHLVASCDVTFCYEWPNQRSIGSSHKAVFSNYSSRAL